LLRELRSMVSFLEYCRWLAFFLSAGWLPSVALIMAVTGTTVHGCYCYACWCLVASGTQIRCMVNFLEFWVWLAFFLSAGCLR
jgi:hypothetical protein